MFLNGLWQSWIIERVLLVYHNSLLISQVHAVLWFSSNHLYPKYTSAIHFYFTLPPKPFLFLTNQLTLLFCFSFILFEWQQFCFHTVWMANSFSFSRFWYKHSFLITSSIYMNITGENYIIICVIIVWCLSFHWNLGLIRPCWFFSYHLYLDSGIVLCKRK